MQKVVRVLCAVVAVLFAASLVCVSVAEAKGRKGSIRVGGYTSSGKGSKYIGGRRW